MPLREEIRFPQVLALPVVLALAAWVYVETDGLLALVGTGLLVLGAVLASVERVRRDVFRQSLYPVLAVVLVGMGVSTIATAPTDTYLATGVLLTAVGVGFLGAALGGRTYYPVFLLGVGVFGVLGAVYFVVVHDLLRVGVVLLLVGTAAAIRGGVLAEETFGASD